MPEVTTTKVLIIGVCRVGIITNNTDFIHTANYVEAIELLQTVQFDRVVTDAVLGEKSGLDVLRYLKDAKFNRRIPSTVCHKEQSCQVHGRSWTINRSLEVFFNFATYYQGSIDGYLESENALTT